MNLLKKGNSNENMISSLSQSTFATYIKDLRIQKKIKQKDMAKKLLTTPSRYSKIEGGYQEPTFVELQIICRELDINLNELFKKEA